MKKIFVIVLIFRLLVSLLPGFEIDMTGWRFWAARMVEVGPAQFYSTKIFTDNPPGFLYIFWGIGAIKQGLGSLGVLGFLGKDGFDWLLKLPTNLFDLGTGLIIYKIIEGRLGKLGRLGSLGVLGFLGYTLNPAIWFNTSVFGQFDGAAAFFSLLSIYLILEKKNWWWVGVVFAISWAIKPQAIFLAPGLGIIVLYEVFGLAPKRKRGVLARPRLVKLIAGFILTTFLLYLPFFPKNPLSGIFYVFNQMNNIYSCATCFAFNFWGLFGNWQNDQALFLDIPLLWWGIILTGLSLGVIFLSLLRKSFSFLSTSGEYFAHPRGVFNASVYLAISLSVMAAFTFLTRMHERYLFPFFAFFLIASLLSKSRKLMLFYVFFSLFNLLNVYFPYANYNTNLHLTPGLVVFLSEHFKFFSAVGFGSFLVLLWWYLRDGFFKRWSCVRKTTSCETSAWKKVLPQKRWSFEAKKIPWSKREIIMVFLLVFVSFVIRVIRLDIPKTFYFDEVYHAFTAREMLTGNKAAWEWWNSPPQGFAYEWTHPPLAKEAMVLGMRVFGQNPFGWRIPGVILGTGCILILYLIGRELFNWRAGMISAFLFSFEGLSFVQSRIGMNDIYFLFFMMLAVYLFISKINEQSSINFASLIIKAMKNSPQPSLTKRGSCTLPSPERRGKGEVMFVLMGISLGLSLASKWTAIYGIGILGGLYILYSASGFSRSLLAPAKGGVSARRNLMKLFAIFVLIFLIIPVAVYLITYIPFFTSGGHTWQQFNELQHQMWWYHTGLRATHPYTSPWYSWPFDWRPVWYFVKYGDCGGPGGCEGIANIYAMGNPAVWWPGMVAIAIIIFKMIKNVILRRQPKNLMRSFASLRMTPLAIILLGYFGFFLPWALSPRIMFIYHYLPSVSFMCLALGWGLEKIGGIGVIGEIWGRRITGKLLIFAFLLLTFLVFLYFYPHLSALPVPKSWSDQYFWFGSWR